VSRQVAAIGDVAEVAAGGGAPQDAKAYTIEGTPFVRAGSLKRLLGGDSETSLERLTDEVAKQHKLRKFPLDTVIFAKSGMSATKGLIYRLREDAYIVNHLAALVPSKRILPEFLEHSLRIFSPTRLIQDAAYPSIRLSEIAAAKIPLPPVEEQRRIVTVLDKADELRAKRRAALKELNTLTQSIFLEMFGDPFTNPKGWPIKTVGDVASKITDGEHQTPQRTTQGIKLLSARNVRDGFIDVKDVDYIGPEEHERIRRRCNPEKGDILISCSGTIGRVAIVQTTEPISLVRSVALVKPNRALVDEVFLSNYLRTPALHSKMQRSANSSSQANLFQGQIRELPTTLPPLSLQRGFASRITAIETLKAKHRTALAELGALFTSLQHRAFSGKL
jgi:type I restriction enzyme S subunit